MAFLQLACRPRGKFGWLYLIGLNDGRVKVGRSVRVRERLAHHRRVHGGSLAWAHVFPQNESGHWECAALYDLSRAGQRVGRTEAFIGVTKAQAIAICRRHVSPWSSAPAQPAEQGA